MNQAQLNTVNILHRHYGITRVLVWDYQPGVVFIEYKVGGGRAEVLPNGRAFRRSQPPDESLGRVHDVTREALGD